MREIKVGEVFEHEGMKLKCVQVKEINCCGCYFASNCLEKSIKTLHGGPDYEPLCTEKHIVEKNNVIFVEVKE